MARTEGKLPVFLGSDPFGGPCGPTVIGMAEFNSDGDITITIKSDNLTTEIEQLVTTDQLIGFALNVAYKAEPAKKGSE